MITYVNTVLVSNVAGSPIATKEPVASATDTPSADAGKFIVKHIDDEKFKVGMITDKNVEYINPTTKMVEFMPIVRWSHDIRKNDIKSAVYGTYADDTEDTIKIDFSGLKDDIQQLFAVGGKRIIVRLTFKDTPTRYRKWTESYEYVTASGDTTETIAANIAKKISKEYKRARVYATATGAVITLTAMKYSDDNAVDTLNWHMQNRFNANVYFTDPAADGWESKNKFFPAGVSISKEPGVHYTATAKLVRDREAQSFGYMGILNRGECTWPIIKPDMNTKLDSKYNYLTLEFENNYRSADDLQRKTKESLEIYAVGTITALQTAIQTEAGITIAKNAADGKKD